MSIMGNIKWWKTQRKQHSKYWEKFHLVELNILVQNSSKTTKKFFTFDVSTSIRGLHQKKLVTLKNVLVHPKDREDKEQTTEYVYKVPCASCEKTYIGETGRKLGVRLQEHRSEVESKTNRAFTRSHRSSLSAESNRSALTDQAVQENHVISWSAASVTDRVWSIYQMDQGGSSYPEGRSTIHEPGRRELPTQSYVRPWVGNRCQML